MILLNDGHIVNGVGTACNILALRIWAGYSATAGSTPACPIPYHRLRWRKWKWSSIPSCKGPTHISFQIGSKRCERNWRAGSRTGRNGTGVPVMGCHAGGPSPSIRLFSAGIPGNFFWAPLEKIRNAACLTLRKNRAPGTCFELFGGVLTGTFKGSRGFFKGGINE